MVYLCLSLIHCILLSLLFPHRLFLTIKSDAKHCHNIGCLRIPFLRSLWEYLVGLCVQTRIHTQSLSFCEVLKFVLDSQRTRFNAGNEHLPRQDNPLNSSQEMTNQWVGSSSLTWGDLSEPVLILPYRNVRHQHYAETHTLFFVKQAQYF